MKIELSSTEKSQLGNRKILKNGSLSTFSYPSANMWPKLREYLVQKSFKTNSLLDTNLTAYTPGETWKLLQHPIIRKWHQEMSRFKVPAGTKAIVFVPCAKTKPWKGPAISKSKLYTAYNQLLKEEKDLYFVTISEPLGVVPHEYWDSFPQYDNPGLFRDDALRSGMMTEEWSFSPFKQKYIIPFDEKLRQKSIEYLGAIIGAFLTTNQNVRMLSFVDNVNGDLSTHTQMLKRAKEITGLEIDTYFKKTISRKSPYEYMKAIFNSSRLGKDTPGFIYGEELPTSRIHSIIIL
jgi:hypothetical protein